MLFPSFFFLQKCFYLPFQSSPLLALIRTKQKHFSKELMWMRVPSDSPSNIQLGITCKTATLQLTLLHKGLASFFFLKQFNYQFYKSFYTRSCRYARINVLRWPCLKQPSLAHDAFSVRLTAIVTYVSTFLRQTQEQDRNLHISTTSVSIIEGVGLLLVEDVVLGLII